MSGENAFGWTKVALIIAVLALVAWLGYKGAAWLKAFFVFGQNNPAKSAADSLASAVTGRPETLGGAVAELFNGTTKAANAMLRSPPIPPAPEIGDNFVGDLPLDTSPGIVSNVGGAATGRVYKPQPRRVM